MKVHLLSLSLSPSLLPSPTTPWSSSSISNCRASEYRALFSAYRALLSDLTESWSGCLSEKGRATLHCLNLPFGQLWEVKIVILFLYQEILVDLKRQVCIRNFLQICPFCTKPWGIASNEISRYQGRIPLFAVSVEFCCFRWFSVSILCRGLMWPPRLGTKGADLLEIPVTNFPVWVNQSLLIQERNYKLALPKLTKRQV